MSIGNFYAVIRLMNLTALLVTIPSLSGCISFPKYKMGDCIVCVDAEPIPGVPRLIYKVTAVDKGAKTYSITTFAEKDQGNEIRKMIVDTANKVHPTMTFDELDSSQPQGRTVKCVMTKIACP